MNISYTKWVSEGLNYNKQGPSKYANTHTGVLMTNGVFVNKGSSACHGVFLFSEGHPKNFTGDLPETLYSWKMPNVFPTNKEVLYYTWLLNKSPWSKVFVEKDYEVVKQKGFSLSTNFPADYVASALVATRYTSEIYNEWTTRHFRTFEDLVNEGVETLWAFVMSMMYAKKHTSSEYSYRMQNGHEIVPPDWSLATIKNFVEGRFKESLLEKDIINSVDANASNRLFRHRGGYSTIGTAFKADSDVKNAKTLSSKLAYIWGQPLVKGVDLNIFRGFGDSTSYPTLTLKELLLATEQVKEAIYE